MPYKDLEARRANQRLNYDPDKKAAYRKRIHVEALDAYGDGYCAYCGSDEDLQLDHVNGDGASHRAEAVGDARAAGAFVLWLRRHGWPNDPPIQVLCEPCHRAKSNEERVR